MVIVKKYSVVAVEKKKKRSFFLDIHITLFLHNFRYTAIIYDHNNQLCRPSVCTILTCIARVLTQKKE